MCQLLSMHCVLTCPHIKSELTSYSAFLQPALVCYVHALSAHGFDSFRWIHYSVVLITCRMSSGLVSSEVLDFCSQMWYAERIYFKIQISDVTVCDLKIRSSHKTQHKQVMQYGGSHLAKFKRLCSNSIWTKNPTFKLL